MSRAFLVSLILAEALAVASCISPARDGGAPPIVIGIYSDLSSTGAREGNDVLKGAELRVRDANQARGLGVRTVVLKHLDMRQNPTEAVKCYTTLSQEMGACVVIGSAVFNAGVAVSPVADMVKVPLLSLGLDDRVSTPDLKPEAPDATGLARRYGFIVLPSASQVASGMAGYALWRFSVHRYATYYDPTSALSQMQARTFENVVRKAGKVVAITIEAPQAEADFGRAVTRLRDADAEAVFVCATVEQNAAFARKAREMSYRPTLIGNQEWYNPMLDLAGEAAEGAWFAMPIAPDDQALSALSSRFQAVYGEPPRPAVLAGYEAVGLALAAIRNAGTVDPQRVRDALEQMTGYKGLFSTFGMDRKTHRPVEPPVAVMRVVDGRYVTVEARFIPRLAKPAAQGAR